MARQLPGFVPPLAAFALTLVVGGLNALAVSGAHEAVALGLLAALMPLILAVAVAWGLALLAGRPRRLAPLAAAGWLAAGLVLLPGATTWTLAGYVVAGLAAGLAVARRWRFDAAVAAVVLPLLPGMVWATLQEPPAELFASMERDMTEVLRENLPAGASEADRDRALETQVRAVRRFVAVMERVYPWFVGQGLLAIAAIVLAVTGWGIRRLGFAWPGWGLPPLTRWRLPFYLVWVLVAGIGLALTRAPVLATAGWNVALLAATVICLQGLSVQAWVTARMMGPVMLTVYWLVMGLFFAPLILASGVVLGLADQWLDIRRLDAGSAGNDPPEGER